MIEKVAAAVRVAMERAGITDPADVHYVQTKTPLLTIHTIRDAKSRGKTVWTEHTHESMDLSNGCTALGIAVALGEIEMPTDADVMHDRSLFSSVASCSSGVELDQAQVVVVGNARGVGGRYRIGHAVMQDALDAGRHLGRHQGCRARPPRAPAPQRHRRAAGQRLPQVRGLARRPGRRPAQRDARRLRRALAPPDQVVRRRRHRVGDRRPGGVRVGVGGAPGPRRRRPGRGHRRPRRRRAHRLPPARPAEPKGATGPGPTRHTVRVPTTERLDGLDAARGLAVLSMLVAHLCPAGGVFTISEYLTAPLFAVIIGISMGVRLAERRPPAGTFLLDNLQRGLVLVVLGVLLQAIYAQIDVVLPYLGVLVIVLAPLALLLHRLPVLTLGIAGALAVVGPARRRGARARPAPVAGSWPAGPARVGGHRRVLPADVVPADGARRPGPRERAPPRGPAAGGLRRRRCAVRAERRRLRARPRHTGRVDRVLRHHRRGRRRHVPGHGHGRRELCRGGPAPAGRCRRGARAVAVDRPAGPDRLHAADPVPRRDPARRGPRRDDSWLILGSTTSSSSAGAGCSNAGSAPGPLEWVVHRLRPPSRPEGRHEATSADGAGAG